jgi:subtilase family serine protease
MEREKKIMEIAAEIDRLLTNGIEIHPNSPIHEKLNQALHQPAVISWVAV